MGATFLLLAFLSSVSCFTPPRIIYGGWTPILPGHPFYFGTLRKHHHNQLEYASQPNYGHQASTSHYSSHSSSPYKNQDHDEEEYRSYRYGKGNSPTGTYQHDQTKYNDHRVEVPKLSNIHTKSIFSYYPPQSAYDKPKDPLRVEHKPVYHEVPKRPVEDPYKFASYIPPKAQGFLPQDLKILNHGGGEAYLNIAPIGNVNSHAIRTIGHINLDNIGYFPSSEVRGSPLYQSNHGITQLLHNPNAAIHNFRPQASRYHDTPKLNYVNHNHLQASELHRPRETINTFKGAAYPHSESDVIRNLKDNKREHILRYKPNTGYKPAKDGQFDYYLDGSNYKHRGFSSNPYILSSAQLYPSKSGSFYDNKYASSDNSPSQQSSTNADLHNLSYLNKINQMKKFRYPKSKYNTGSKSYYTTPFLTPGSYNFNQYPRKPSIATFKTPRTTYSPKDPISNDYKNVQVGKFYRDPSVVSDVQSTPSVVEEEVEIVHIPADSPRQYSSPAEEVLYFKGSGPRKHPTEYRNRGNITIKNYEYKPETVLEEPIEFHILEDYPHQGHDSETASRHQNPEEHDSVFVGTRSLNTKDFQNDDSQEHKVGNSIDKKQFFHAYYAPSDHSPPKGYLKMSTEEFHKLFKDAEIQYIQRDGADELSSDRRAEKRSS